MKANYRLSDRPDVRLLSNGSTRASVAQVKTPFHDVPGIRIPDIPPAGKVSAPPGREGTAWIDDYSLSKAEDGIHPYLMAKDETRDLTWSRVLNSGCIGAHRFIRFRRVGRHIVDFLCRPLLLIIDIEPDMKPEGIHQLLIVRRTMELRNLGFYTMRFYEHEVRSYPDQVRQLITNRANILAMKKEQLIRAAQD